MLETIESKNKPQKISINRFGFVIGSNSVC